MEITKKSSWKQKALVAGNTESVLCNDVYLSFNKVTPWFFFATSAEVVQSWDFRWSKRPIFQKRHNFSANWCAPHPLREEVVASASGNQVYLWDLRRTKSALFVETLKQDELVHCCEFSPDGKKMVAGTQRTVIWDVVDFTPRLSIILEAEPIEKKRKRKLQYYEAKETGLKAVNEDQVTVQVISF